MNYWLIKFAPFRYSWTDVLRNGKFEIYSVHNAQARNNLKAMKIGDEVLFYQSQENQAIMGKMKVIEEAHQDKTTSDTRWLSVIFEPIHTFEKPITLAQIKSIPELQNISLIKQPRLAVMSLTDEEISIIEKTSKLFLTP